jgi:hypothetical protein
MPFIPRENKNKILIIDCSGPVSNSGLEIYDFGVRVSGIGQCLPNPTLKGDKFMNAEIIDRTSAKRENDDIAGDRIIIATLKPFVREVYVHRMNAFITYWLTAKSDDRHRRYRNKIMDAIRYLQVAEAVKYLSEEYARQQSLKYGFAIEPIYPRKKYE